MPKDKYIIVTTTDGYIYEVYYDEETGKKEIEYVGKEDGEGIPEITASYDKVKAVIAAQASCKGGIKEIQLIYKKEVVQTQPGETANFDVQQTGWYQVKGVANNGKTISTWVRVPSTVIAPLIEVISDGEQENEWYGKDDKPVQVRISTDNPTATGVYYKTNKDEEFTYVEGREATLTIQDSGRTIIYAYVTDKQGNESEQANKEIKYDNIHPEVGEIEIEGTKGIIDGTETGWYVSEEVTIKLNNMTDEPIESGIEGYYYWEIPEGSNPNDITEEQKTFSKGQTGEIKIVKEGKVTIGIQAKDKAGNITETSKIKTITIQKDSIEPVDFLPSVGNITAEGFTVNAGTTDATSEISHYNCYVRQGSTLVKELKNNEAGQFQVTGIPDNTTYSITVEALDKAGNIRTGKGITGTTEIANTPPTKAVVSFNSKGTNYIKVNAKSEDVDGDKLTYTLYYGTSSTRLTASTPLSNQTQNVQVAIQTPTISSYTYYYWRVDVSDGKVTTEGDIQAQVRTYCPGTGYTCNGPFVEENGKTCSTCSGSGKVTSGVCGGWISPHRDEGVRTGTFTCISCGTRERHQYVSNGKCDKCGSYGSWYQCLSCGTVHNSGKILKNGHCQRTTMRRLLYLRRRWKS